MFSPEGPGGTPFTKLEQDAFVGGGPTSLEKLHGGSSLWARSDSGDCYHQTGLPDLSGDDGTWEQEVIFNCQRQGGCGY